MKKNLLLILLITLISCEVTNKNFEISSPNFTYEFYENYIERGLNLAGRVEFVKNKIQTGEEDYDMLKKKVYNNIRTISLNLNVKNITGENLEESKLYTTIIFEYPNETKEFNFDSKRINLDNSSLWYNDEIKTINFEYAFNFLDSYDENVFKHKPSKIKARISIQGVNSVGFNVYETVFDDEISISNFE